MGRQKRRRMINIQNLNGLGGSESSKRQKATRNTLADLEVTIGKENVCFYVSITDFFGHRVLPNDIMEELGKNGVV